MFSSNFWESKRIRFGSRSALNQWVTHQPVVFTPGFLAALHQRILDVHAAKLDLVLLQLLVELPQEGHTHCADREVGGGGSKI